jgi:CTP:molybdopterin cytidylyltransferase MocA
VTVAAAILAAGRGSRLETSTPKPLTLLHGRPLVAWALDAAQSAELDPVVLVVGRAGRTVGRHAPADVEVVRARRWRQGIAQSLRAALAALDSTRSAAVCVGLADQPLIGPDAYRRLTRAHAQGARLAVATYGGQRANPVLLDRSLWPAAAQLRGDVGARALMATSDVVEVDCTGTGDPSDVDTLDDLRALEGRTL